MTPEEKKQLDTLTQKVNAIDAGFRNLSQLDPQFFQVILAIAKTMSMNDLANVDDTGISNGQLLKWNTSTSLYEPADDIDT